MNQQDPLAQLRDLHMPDPVSWWPPAPGWWFLATLLVAAIAAGAWLLFRHYRSNAYRRAARRELESAWQAMQRDGDRNGYLQVMTSILRRTALAAYPGKPVGHLHGHPWLEFLDNTSAKPESAPFSTGPGRDLLTLPYRPVAAGVDLQPLHRTVSHWLATHRKSRSGGLFSRSREAHRATV